MTSLAVGDLSQFFTLSRSGATLKADSLRLSNELVSGFADDTAAHLSGDFGPLGGIESSLARLRGYRAVTTEAALSAETMQTVLGRISDISSDLGQSLLAGAGPGTPLRIATLTAQAGQNFETAVSALNTRIGDRSLFSGIASTTSPLPSGANLLDTLQTVVAGAGSAADVQTALDDWFAAPTGYAATYLGGSKLAEIDIAPTESTRIDITAADPAIAETLKGLAMAALMDRGVLANNPTEQTELLRRSGESLLVAQSHLGEMSGRLGTVQAQIDQAAQRNSAETSALNIALSDMLSIDTYEAASRLQQTQTQLETLYTLTSRLSRLSLVNFL